MKRIVDMLASFLGLLMLSPFLLVVLLLIWLQDLHSPFYLAPRVGRNGRLFRMVKLRSMEINADESGVDSTSARDSRITPLGRLVRKYKLDELSQLWNVFKGDMSLVGPRPNVKRETDLYTAHEKQLLQVRPGMTDFSSIVFSDEGEILNSHDDPDIAYNQLIRPGKSRLGLFYIEHPSLWCDLQLIWVTGLAMLSRPLAIQGIQRLLRKLGAGPELLELASREKPLVPMPPPGGDRIVTFRGEKSFV